MVENVKELLKLHEGITHEVYLDNENSTIVPQEVVDAMIPYFNQKAYGNPTLTHKPGWEAFEVIMNSFQKISKFMGAKILEETRTLPGRNSSRCRGQHSNAPSITTGTTAALLCDASTANPGCNGRMLPSFVRVASGKSSNCSPPSRRLSPSRMARTSAEDRLTGKAPSDRISRPNGANRNSPSRAMIEIRRGSGRPTITGSR